jgi:hypothetical protein
VQAAAHRCSRGRAVIETSADMVVAIAWYQPDEWDQLRQLCPDLDDTYEEWLAAAQKKQSKILAIVCRDGS